MVGSTRIDATPHEMRLCRRAIALIGLALAVGCGDPAPGALDVLDDSRFEAAWDAGAAPAPAPCVSGTTRCPGRAECVDLARDDAHCGACGLACFEDERCEEGACVELVEPGARRWRRELHVPTDDDDDELHTTTKGLQLAGDRDGNAIAVWSSHRGQNLASHLSLWAARYDASSASWGPAERLGEGGDASLAMTPGGDAFVAWIERHQELALRRFDAETGTFGPTERVATEETNTLGAPNVVVNEAGDALLLWHWRPHSVLTDADPGRHWARWFDGTSETWGDATTIDTDDRFYEGPTRGAVYPSGDALVVWVIPRRGSGDIYLVANRFDAASGTWDRERTIAPIDDYRGHEVAIAPSGDALVVYGTYSASEEEPQLHWHHYDAAADTWAPAELLHRGAQELLMSVDPVGRVRLIARDDAISSSTTTATLWGLRYDPATRTWTDEGLIASTVPGFGNGASVASNAAGEAVVVLNGAERVPHRPRTGVLASHFDPATLRWTEPELIEAIPGGDIAPPRVVLSPNGDAVAAWRLEDGDDNTMTWVSNYR